MKAKYFRIAVSLVFPLNLVADSCFVKNDIEIISLLLQHFQIRDYILVSSVCHAPSLISSQIKRLSQVNKFGVYLPFAQLIREPIFPDSKIMVTIKISDDFELSKIMENLKMKVKYL